MSDETKTSAFGPAVDGLCHFRWQTGDEPVDECVRPKGSAHGDRHVSADTSWILVQFAEEYREGSELARGSRTPQGHGAVTLNQERRVVELPELPNVVSTDNTVWPAEALAAAKARAWDEAAALNGTSTIEQIP